MNELLFNNLKEKEALESLLALSQIKKCDKEIEKYTNEIEELKEEMTSILKNEDIDETYVEKIYKYKGIVNSANLDGDRINDLDKRIVENNSRINEFQRKISEVEDNIVRLRKEIFESANPSKVIECQNEVEENNQRLLDLNEILNNLITDNNPLMIEKEYLIARNELDFNISKDDVKKDLDRIESEFNSFISKLDLPIRESIEFCQKKISNREAEIEKYNVRKSNVLSSYPNALSVNAEKAYDDIKDLLRDLSIAEECGIITDKNIFDVSEENQEEGNYDEVIPEEEIVLEDKNEIGESDESQFEDVEEVSKEETNENIILEEEPVEPDSDENQLSINEELTNILNSNRVSEEIEESENNEVPEEQLEKIDMNSLDDEYKIDESYNIPIFEDDEDKPEESTDDIESVSYVLSDGESLANIAEKVYPSKDNWTAIYYFNKEAIDNYLVSNGISSDFETIKELANDTSLFTGIKLEIPTDFNYKI